MFHVWKNFWYSFKIFIPNGNRCCSDLLIKKRFYKEDIGNFPVLVYSSSSNVEVDEVSKLLEFLSISVDRELTDKVGDYTLSEERLKAFTGLTWEQVIELKGMMTSMRNTENRTVTQAVVVFLFRMRTGLSNEVIRSVLECVLCSKQVSDFSDSILKSFEIDVLPTRFDIKSCTQQLLLENTAPIAKELHQIKDDEVSLVCDGTFFVIRRVATTITKGSRIRVKIKSL